MATRDTITSATAGTVSGDTYMDNVAGHIARLYDAAAFPLTSVGGTGNAVTASLDPVLLSGLVTGMKFTITWAATNTAGATLAINGGSAVSMVDAAGDALTGAALVAGARSLLEYDGAALRVLTSGAGGADGFDPDVITFTSSGVFNKALYGPYHDDKLVMIEGWGGGGSGATSGSGWRNGGGGGGYDFRWVRWADLLTTESVIIGAGGVAGAGGATSFGSHVSATGGGLGAIDVTGVAGVGAFSGGTTYGGGNGGRFNTVSSVSEAGGVSTHGGDGGAGGSNGQTPGGGGGGNGNGARGEVRVYL